MTSDSAQTSGAVPASKASNQAMVTVNGDARELSSATSVQGLLLLLGLEPTKIAVERNLEIVPKSQYGETVLCDGDRIEIVQFVGGG